MHWPLLTRLAVKSQPRLVIQWRVMRSPASDPLSRIFRIPRNLRRILFTARNPLINGPVNVYNACRRLML